MERTTERRETDPKTGGQKGVKEERYDLIPIEPLDELARVYGYGARKYSEDNWRKGYSWRWSIGALFRHVSRWLMGEERDPETGCHHLAHAMFHLFALYVFQIHSLGTDDRGRSGGHLHLGPRSSGPRPSEKEEPESAAGMP